MKRVIWSASLLLLLLASFFMPTFPVAAQTGAPLVMTMRAEGALTPAMEQYLSRGLTLADRRGAELVILELNTPGGSIDLMEKIVQLIRGSAVPVVVYVSPRGAMAGSAGTVITLAGHAAAMAPETTIGAASPVGSQGEDIGETMEAKVKEMLKASVRTLTERRGGKAIAMAEDAIENAKAYSSQEAADANLVDFIAASREDLLAKLDGFSVEMPDGARTLHTAGAVVEEMPMTLVENILTMLTNPNIVFLLLSLGIQAIFIEMSSPGGWVAGFIGVVCVALAVYGLGILPVNWFGLIFLLMSFVLFILEIKAPTHGALTVAGIGSFIAGALVLFNSPGVPEFQRVSVPLVIGVAAVTAALFGTIVAVGIRALRAPVRTGALPLIGRKGVARTALEPEGTVQVGSELWTAAVEDDAPFLPEGAHVEVLRVEGVRLRVRESPHT